MQLSLMAVKYVVKVQQYMKIKLLLPYYIIFWKLNTQKRKTVKHHTVGGFRLETITII